MTAKVCNEGSSWEEKFRKLEQQLSLADKVGLESRYMAHSSLELETQFSNKCGYWIWGCMIINYLTD